MLYMIGIIEKFAYDDLILISKVRNRFAHSLDVTNFDDPVITEWIKSMWAYSHLQGIVIEELNEDEPDYSFKRAMKFTMTENTRTMLLTFRQCVRTHAILITAWMKRHSSSHPKPPTP